MSLADPAFRALFEDSPIGIVIVDKDLKIVDVNAAYCDLVGYTEAEMMSRHIPDFTHPEDRQRDNEFAALVLSGALPRYHAEKRYITKSGRHRLGQHLGDGTARPERCLALRLQHGAEPHGTARAARPAAGLPQLPARARPRGRLA